MKERGRALSSVCRKREEETESIISGEKAIKGVKMDEKRKITFMACWTAGWARISGLISLSMAIW